MGSSKWRLLRLINQVASQVLLPRLHHSVLHLQPLALANNLKEVDSVHLHNSQQALANHKLHKQVLVVEPLVDSSLSNNKHPLSASNSNRKHRGPLVLPLVNNLNKVVGPICLVSHLSLIQDLGGDGLGEIERESLAKAMSDGEKRIRDDDEAHREEI